MGKKLIASIGLSTVVYKEFRNGHIFYNVVKIISEIVYNNCERQCANGELLQVRQRSVCDIKKRNVIEMTICVHIIN